MNSIPQQTTHQFEMSSSSASASASAARSTSYSYGIPGSQVTISLNKSGNHSVILSRGNSKTSSSVPVGTRKFPDGWVGPANTPFCKVCYDAGLPVADYTDHFVKDQPGPDGHRDLARARVCGAHARRAAADAAGQEARDAAALLVGEGPPTLRCVRRRVAPWCNVA